MDEQKIICMVKKNPYMTAQQVKNALQDVGRHVSLSMIKRSLHDQNHKMQNPGKPQKQRGQATIHKNILRNR